MTENFSNLGVETDIQVHEAQRALNKVNPKRATPRYIIIKMAKIENKENLEGFKRKLPNHVQGYLIKW